MKMYQKIKIINYHLSVDTQKLKFRPYFDSNNGFDFYVFENEKVQIFLQTSVVEENLLNELFSILSDNISEGLKSCNQYVSEVFQIYVWCKIYKKLFTLTDYLGIGTNYVIKHNSGITFFSNFFFNNLLEDKLILSKTKLQSYLILGYPIEQDDLPYTNVESHKGGIIYEYSDGKVIQYNKDITYTKYDLNESRNMIKSSFEVSSLNEKLFFGLTAGKDSLALLSVSNSKHIKSGSFGHELSDDVIQGKNLSKKSHITYSYCSYASSKEFVYYSNEIANISGGLSTSSYVDMLKFSDKIIPSDYTFVMGEGGECVRDFFDASNNLQASLNNYTTPSEFINKCLYNSENEIAKVKETLLKKISSRYKGESLEDTLLTFYRKGRMPGNFSNRTKLINRYRNKSAPFLNINFIKSTYNLPHCNYAASNIHREIVKSNETDELLPYFDNPIKSNYNAQNWDERFQNEIGKTIADIMSNVSPATEKIFDIEGIIELLNSEIIKPTRGIYFILRILSFIIFIDNNEESIIIVE